MVCARLKPAVSGLEQDFPGKVTARNVDASTPEASDQIQKLGFISHGLVIRSPEGTVLWKEGDHTVRVEDAREALRRILGT
jgi:hypothetical protein